MYFLLLNKIIAKVLSPRCFLINAFYGNFLHLPRDGRMHRKMREYFDEIGKKGYIIAIHFLK